nr:hypothetical protein [Tanacetum cinerariifolium]
MMEKEPEATKDTELPSTKNIQPPSVQVPDKEPIDKPFDVPKTKTNLPYPSRLFSINLNSQRLNKEKQEVKNVVEQLAKRGSQPEYSSSMRYKHPNTTSKIESGEIIKSGVEELVPILNENEVTSEDKRECDVPIFENSPICDDHSEIFSDSKNDNDKQSLTLKCGDTPSISYNNFESLNKVDLIDATCEEYSQEVLGFFDRNILYFENLLKEDSFQLPLMDLKVAEEPPEVGLKDFFNELAHINPEITKADFDYEEEIRLIENLLYDNSSPRPLEELYVNADTIVESFPSSLIPVQDNDSQREDINIVTNTDELLPPGVKPA